MDKGRVNPRADGGGRLGRRGGLVLSTMSIEPWLAARRRTVALGRLKFGGVSCDGADGCGTRCDTQDVAGSKKTFEVRYDLRRSSISLALGRSRTSGSAVIVVTASSADELILLPLPKLSRMGELHADESDVTMVLAADMNDKRWELSRSPSSCRLSEEETKLLVAEVSSKVCSGSKSPSVASRWCSSGVLGCRPNRFGSLMTGDRVGGHCCESSPGLGAPVSVTGLFPPSVSISFRNSVIQLSMSPAASKTMRISEACRLSFSRRPNLPSNDLVSWLAAVASSKMDETCRTQCRPGMTSLAKAAESLPSCTTFSGRRSWVPSPAYCSK